MGQLSVRFRRERASESFLSVIIVNSIYDEKSTVASGIIPCKKLSFPEFGAPTRRIRRDVGIVSGAMFWIWALRRGCSVGRSFLRRSFPRLISSWRAEQCLLEYAVHRPMVYIVHSDSILIGYIVRFQISAPPQLLEVRIANLIYRGFFFFLHPGPGDNAPIVDEACKNCRFDKILRYLLLHGFTNLAYFLVVFTLYPFTI